MIYVNMSEGGFFFLYSFRVKSFWIGWIKVLITTHKHSMEFNTSKSHTQNGSTTHTQVSTNHTTNIRSTEPYKGKHNH